MTARNQPTEEPAKIQFAEERMCLLDGLLLGKYATVGFTMHGVNYYWEGAVKYPVLLTG